MIVASRPGVTMVAGWLAVGQLLLLGSIAADCPGRLVHYE